MVPLGYMENVFQHSHPSSPFFPFLTLVSCRSLTVVLEKRLANGYGVEMGDHVRPGQTKRSSLGHQGLFQCMGSKIDEQYCQRGLRV